MSADRQNPRLAPSAGIECGSKTAMAQPLTGWLEKEGTNGFQRRYFVLEGTSLMYYYTSASAQASVM
jgi:hypothetical protein